MVRRWRPSVAMMITLTVIIAMVLGFSLREAALFGLPYFGVSKQQLAPQSEINRHRGFPERFALLINVLDNTPSADMPGIVTSSERPHIVFRLANGSPPIAEDIPGPYTNFLRRRIEAALVKPRQIIVADNYTLDNKDNRLAALPQSHWAVAEAPVTKSLWLVAVSEPPNFQEDEAAQDIIRASLLGWLALSFLLSVALSYVAAQRVVRPLAKLAVSASQIGAKGDAPPLEAAGPKEVNEVMQAFNAMQARLRRFDADRTRMIGAMSHDLRTPLTRLKMRVEMLDQTPEQAKMLKEIDSMCRVIDSVLAFAKDDATTEPRALVDLSSLVEGICEDAADAGEPVTFSGPRHLTILGRPSSLRRAISNVIENAVRYGNKALVSIEQTAKSTTVIVEDEGPGIPRHEREKVFDPFYRVDGSRTPQTAGVGLGLSVARSIILEHGGEISLAARKGGGLSCRIELPLQSRRRNDPEPA